MKSDPAAREAELQVPEENKPVSFIVGVDSLRNTMDVSQRTGVLMWPEPLRICIGDGTAAIFSSAGRYQRRFNDGRGFPIPHRGFGGYSSSTANNIRKITLDLTARGVGQGEIRGKSTNIHLMVDILSAERHHEYEFSPHCRWFIPLRPVHPLPIIM